VDSSFLLPLITYIDQPYRKLSLSVDNFFSLSAGGFRGRVDTRTFVKLKADQGRRYSLPGIESEEDKGKVA
jgi:hypothetical protein